MTTLFFSQAGPMIRYEPTSKAMGVLHIEDLNPEMKTKWVMSNLEMFKLGCKFIWASMKG